MKENCCKDCKYRYVGCHQTCKDYKDFCEENENRKQNIKNDKAKKNCRNIKFKNRDMQL